MADNELLYSQFLSATRWVLNRFLKQYFENHPDGRNFITGKEYLGQYNEEYKNEITLIATSVINDAQSGDKQTYYKVYKQTQVAMEALSNEIMNDALGIKTTALAV